jgi:hypothetical protein
MIYITQILQIQTIPKQSITLSPYRQCYNRELHQVSLDILK